MNKGRWFEYERKDFLLKMAAPFHSTPSQSIKSKAATDREYNVESFMNRITPQLQELIEKELPWSTPEEWDSSFYILGGGQSRRKSWAILQRMSWELFLELSLKIINKTD